MIDFGRTLVSPADLPLFGKRVLVCAPRNYAAKLIRLLVLRGARPIWMPTIVIEPMADYREFDAAIRRMGDYRWLAFTSRNGIEAFFDRLVALGLYTGILEHTKLAALGNDGKALEARGLKVDCLPTVATTKGMVEELERRGEAHGRILVPVPEVQGMEEPSIIPDFTGWLTAAGMDVHRVPAYVTRRVVDGFEVEKWLIIDHRLDLIAFTSVGEIESLLHVLGDERGALDSQTIACYGPMTAGGARERNIRVDIMPDQSSAFEHYLRAIEHHFRKLAA